MRQNVKTGIVLFVAAVAVLTLIGCPGPADPVKLSSRAALSSLTIAGVSVELGTPSMNWEETISPENLAHVFLENSQLTQAKVVAQSTENGIVFYAKAKPSVEPWFEPTNVIDFEPEDYLFIEVFSANHDAFNIYGFQIHARNPGMSDFTLGGRSLVGGVAAAGRPIPKFGSLGVPGDSWNTVPQAGEAWFGSNQLGAELVVTIRPEILDASVKLVVVEGSGTPDFTNADSWEIPEGSLDGLIGTKPNPADPDNPLTLSVTLPATAPTTVAPVYIYVEVSKIGAEDETEYKPTYYKLSLIMKSTDREITNARFIIWDGTTKVGEYPVHLGTLGTESWSGGEAYGNYNNGAEIHLGAGTESVNVNLDSQSIVSLYLDAGIAENLKGQPGLVPEEGDPPSQFIGTRPPANLRVELAADYAGALGFSKPDKNQRSSPEFNLGQNSGASYSYDAGKLIGFWWWGIEVTSEIGERGWYKFATRIGSENPETLDSVTINGTQVDFTGIQPGRGPTHYMPVDNVTFATITLPATAFNSSLTVVAKAQDGMYPLIGAVAAPDLLTDVPNISFLLNQDENHNHATATNTSRLAVEPGNFIFIRLTAELAYYYGGSGFAAASWQPFRFVPGTPGYIPQRYYKIQVLRQGDQDGANLAGLTYKGASIAGVPVAAAKITETLAVNVSVGMDSKGSAEEIQTRVTSAWTAQTGNDIFIDDFTNPVFGATLASDSNKARVAFALRPLAEEPEVTSVDFKGNVTVLQTANGPVDASQFFAPEAFPPPDVVPATNTWLVTRVSSESGKQTNYYRFRLLSNAGSSATATAISLGGSAVANFADGLNTAATGTASVSYGLALNAVVSGAFPNVALSVTRPGTAQVHVAVAATANAAPAAWTELSGEGTSVSATLPSVPVGQYVVIRLISGDLSTTNYYKVRLVIDSASTDTSVSAININSVALSPIPAANNAATGTTAIGFDIFSNDASVLTNLTVSASATGTVAYGSAATAAAAPTDWTNTTGIFATWTSGQYLVIRVTAESLIDIAYYKVQITLRDPGTELSGIDINSVAISALPSANSAATGTYAVEFTVADLSGGVTASVSAAAGATVAYGSAATAAVAPADWTNTTGIFATWTSGQYLVIRVTGSASGDPTAYYKVRISE